MTSEGDRSAPGSVATIGGLPLDTHDHLCVLYRGRSQRDELMVDFLAEGVVAGHKCYCMIAPTEHGWIASAVSDRGRQADTAQAGDGEETGDLEFTGPSGSHLQAGGFASEVMLKFWDDWATTTYERQRRPSPGSGRT